MQSSKRDRGGAVGPTPRHQCLHRPSEGAILSNGLETRTTVKSAFASAGRTSPSTFLPARAHASYSPPFRRGTRLSCYQLSTPPVPLSDPQPPFTPLPNESATAFEAFLLYFSLKGKRHLTTVARRTGSSLSTINRWTRDFDWSGRLNAYALTLLKDQAAQDTRQRKEAFDWSERCALIREREWELAFDLLDAIERRLNADVLDEATLADSARSLALASKTARLAAGLSNAPPTSSHEVDARIKEFNDALELVVRNHQAKQAAAAAAAAAAGQPPSTPNV